MSAPRRRHRGIRNSAELTQNRDTAVPTVPRNLRRQAVRYVASQATDAADLAERLSQLGLDPAEGRP